jgi:hypothetical protein
LERIKMRGVVMAFSAWSQNAHAGKEAKALLKRISFRMRNQCLIAVSQCMPRQRLSFEQKNGLFLSRVLTLSCGSAGTSGRPR